MKKKNALRWICAAAAVLLMFAGCSEPIPEDPAEPLRDDELSEEEIPDEAVPLDAFFAQYDTPATGTYQAPAMQHADYHADKASGSDSAKLDLSMVNQGVVGVKATSSKRLKFIIAVNGNNYYFNIKNEGRRPRRRRQKRRSQRGFRAQQRLCPLFSGFRLREKSR